MALEPGGAPVAGEVIANPWEELNATKDKRSWHFIILGFVGGMFQKGTKRVTVESVLSNQLGVRRVVVRALGGARKATEMGVDELLHTFEPVAVASPEGGCTPLEARAGGRGEQDRADFRDFPLISAVLRGAGLMGASETSTEMGDAQGFLAALAGAERVEASKMGAAVVSAEKLLGSRKIDRKDVERALRFGGGGRASPAEKRSVVRELLSASGQAV